MGKGLAILGLILLIIGILPIILTLVGFSMYAEYFYLATYIGIGYELNLAGFIISELMLVLIILGVILFIIGLVR